MEWLSAASWWDFVRSCRDRLYEIEPSWVPEQPLLVRLLLYYLAARVALTVLVAIIHGIGTVVLIAARWVLAATGTLLLFDVPDLVAVPFVRLQAMAAGPLLSTPVRFRSRSSPLPSIDPLDLPDPLPARAALRVFRRVAVALGLFSLGLLALGYLTLQAMLRPRPATFCALLFALWFADLLGPLLAAVSRVRIGDVNLSVFVAAGTLLAVLYAALNSDLRGRAELNKTASLACRTALHASTNAMLDCAAALRAIRDTAVRQLSNFPTTEELRQLTGRDDLEWRLFGPLPRDAGGLNHGLREMPFFRRPAVREYADEVLTTAKKRAHQARSLITEGDVQDHVDTLRDSSRLITEKLDELHENGFTGKLDRVLGQAGTALLAVTYGSGFGTTTVREVYEPDGRTGTDGVLSDRERHAWAMLTSVDPDEPVLREACRVLPRQLRTFLQARHRALWSVAVTEYQLRYLVAKIDKPLSPRLFERIRQAFGK